ncbi:MAG: hypothetical protein KF773_36705 [Deltaproteobacteria bacterium]|nr:hypothetical protein [Deltaproteobacteria bacterium]MCW5804820.1 hypothetical protein [Deltaproteobacteria bacterium]
MADRLDIDALLIGSLYGELSAADEARLQTHLESHPGDRAALASLTRARDAVRESRIFQVQFEPPQAISAVLLQKAAHLVPKKAKLEEVEQEREGWFTRFVRAFVGHPAMAAATMFILVLGIAGTLYVRKGDHFAEPPPPAETAKVAKSEEKANAAAAQTPGPQSRNEQQQLSQDSYSITLGDKSELDEQRKGGSAASDGSKQARRDVLEAKTDSGPKPKDLEDVKAEEISRPGRVVQAEPPKAPATTPPRGQPTTGDTSVDAVTTTGRTELAITAQKLEDKERARGPGNAKESGATGADLAENQPRATSVPPPPPPPPPSMAGAGGGSATVARGEAEGSDTLAWAKQQHAKLVAETQRNQCDAAASIAVAISLRAPSYYQQNVESDRTLKQCIAYINRARELDAEQRARNTRKRLEPEAAPPAPQPAPRAAPDRR